MTRTLPASDDPIIETKFGKVAFRRWGEYSSSMFGTESMGGTAKRLGVTAVLLLADDAEVPSIEEVETILSENIP